jgi:hypothetical protein
MKDFLWPAKRHRKERMRAAVQHTAGIRAVRRIVVYRWGVDYAQRVMNMIYFDTNNKVRQRVEMRQT